MKVRPKGRKQSVELLLHDAGTKKKCEKVARDIRQDNLIARVRRVGGQYAVYGEVRNPGAKTS